MYHICHVGHVRLCLKNGGIEDNKKYIYSLYLWKIQWDDQPSYVGGSHKVCVSEFLNLWIILLNPKSLDIYSHGLQVGS